VHPLRSWREALVTAADRILHEASPAVRYRLFFLALLFMVLLPALTALSGVPAAARTNATRIPSDRVSTELAAATPRSAVVSGPKAAWLETIEVSTEYVVPFWMIGVFAMTLRWAGASYVLRRRVRRSSPAGEHWREVVDNLRRALQIGRVVRVLQAEWLTAPATIGWISPVLLLPMSALSGLPPEQLEAIIAHELAHIRRNDYLANLVQVVAETLLFFHPAVWWLSGRIREEREELCDAIAVDYCGNPQVYAHALLAMEQRQTAPSLIMAADGGSLPRRIFRILGFPRRGLGIRSGSIAIALALLAAILAVATVHRLAGGSPSSLSLAQTTAIVSPFTAEQMTMVYDASGRPMSSRSLTATRPDGSQTQFQTFSGRIGQLFVMRKVELADGSYTGPVELIAGLALGGDAWRQAIQGRLTKLKQHSADCLVGSRGEVLVGAGPVLFGFRTVEVYWTDGAMYKRTRLAAPELGCFNLEELVQMKTPDGLFRPTLETQTVALSTGEPAPELFAFLFNPFRMPAVPSHGAVSAESQVRAWALPTKAAALVTGGRERIRGAYQRPWIIDGV
jgi:beta-lactamase regulating signal transducer with metallopeptidase domain